MITLQILLLAIVVIFLVVILARDFPKRYERLKNARKKPKVPK